ncbi:stage II sporulation protein R [Neobacillus sp. PS3-34]|uniref:stage II sporulation protein R n=1 Tax=Neobacillus sp. PS3-34 TaxID=3070678 RepID=UPI0035A6627B
MSLYIPKNEVAAKEEIVIPGEAIRLRILANSDSGSDQALKRLVRDKVNENITVWVKDLTSIDEARKLIHSKLPEIQQIAEGVVEQQHSDQSVNVKFGKVQFPTKLYGEFLYPAGEYEAILITLGEGKGANWWCVLYPPLCFLDFSSGVAVSQGFDGEKKAQREETKPERKEQREETKPERKDQQVEAKPEQELQISDRKQEDEVSQLEQRNDSDEEPPQAPAMLLIYHL